MGLTPHSPPVKGTPAMSSKFPTRGVTDLTTRGRAASTPDKTATRGPTLVSDSRAVRILDPHLQNGEVLMYFHG